MPHTSNNKFLYKLATEIIGYGIDLQKVCLIFPTKRAGLYFKKYLAEILKQNFFAPNVFSIQEFIETHSALLPADNLIFVYELFEQYNEIYGDKFPFEKFYSFGNLLITDFNNIDKNLVHTGTLFRVIKSYKEIEQQFPHPIDDNIALKEFLEAFSKYLSKPGTDFFKEFWNKIDLLYSCYKKRLADKSIGYEGMIYRNFVDKLPELKIENKFEKLFFAGFNYLTKSELEIFKFFKDKNIAEFYFDVDSGYYGNEAIKNHEAASFIEKNINILHLTGKNLKWIDNNFHTDEKNISIYSLASGSGQAKLAGQLINENNYDTASTVLILPDENLLMPVLSSLPESCKSFNITMSYPLYLTPVKSLINDIITFHKNKKNIKGTLHFKSGDFQKIILHPYFKFLDTNIIYKINTEIIENKLFYINLDYVEPFFMKSDKIDLSIINMLFSEMKSVSDIVNLIKAIFTKIIENLKSFEVNSIEIEFLYRTILCLNKFEDILKKNKYEMDYNSFSNLISELIYDEKIPFIGEPLAALQIMGLFESRLLDFENVIILSANEGKLPPFPSYQSIIPYNLRKAFGMTLPEDVTKNYSYLFYRLLQRSKNINLLYNSDLSSENKEKSRFIYQLEYELSTNNNIKIQNKSAVFSDNFIESNEITVEKSDLILNKLKKYEPSGDPDKKGKHFSATALNKYINCSLQFYFRHILELEEPEKLELEIDAGMFGSLLHEALHELYSEAQAKKIDVTVEYINSLKTKVDELISNLIENEFKNIEQDKGRFILIKKTLQLYIEKILNMDIKYAPFKILELEHTIRHQITIPNHPNPVSLKALIDRIDIKNNTVRIIDYKTSKIKSTDEIEKIYSHPDYSEHFQMMFYGYLLSNIDIPKDKNLQIAFYTMRNASYEPMFVSKNFSTEQYETASSKISNIINQIFDKNIPFSQTEEIERCEYCDFKVICHRLEKIEEK